MIKSFFLTSILLVQSAFSACPAPIWRPFGELNMNEIVASMSVQDQRINRALRISYLSHLCKTSLQTIPDPILQGTSFPDDTPLLSQLTQKLFGQHPSFKSGPLQSAAPFPEGSIGARLANCQNHHQEALIQLGLSEAEFKQLKPNDELHAEILGVVLNLVQIEGYNPKEQNILFEFANGPKLNSDDLKKIANGTIKLVPQIITDVRDGIYGAYQMVTHPKESFRGMMDIIEILKKDPVGFVLDQTLTDRPEEAMSGVVLSFSGGKILHLLKKSRAARKLVGMHKSELDAWIKSSRMPPHQQKQLLTLLESDPDAFLNKVLGDASNAFLEHLTRMAYNLQGMREFVPELAKIILNTPGSKLFVVKGDLKAFKSINEVLGHAAGDEVLEKLFMSLKSKMRELDIVVRNGGDEFSIFFQAPDMEAANAAMKRFLEMYDEEIKHIQKQIRLAGENNPDAKTFLQNYFGSDWEIKLKEVPIIGIADLSPPYDVPKETIQEWAKSTELDKLPSFQKVMHEVDLQAAAQKRTTSEGIQGRKLNSSI